MQKIEKLIKELFDKMQTNIDLTIEDQGDVFMANIVSDEPSLLIGYKGEHLQAIQHIISSMARSQALITPEKKLVIDINGYRKQKNELLENLIKKLINNVKFSGRPEVLKTMNAYERKIVHLEISKNPDLESESIGEEPNRRVVIRKKK